VQPSSVLSEGAAGSGSSPSAFVGPPAAGGSGPRHAPATGLATVASYGGGYTGTGAAAAGTGDVEVCTARFCSIAILGTEHGSVENVGFSFRCSHSCASVGAH
jgi:hypothetical protein